MNLSSNLYLINHNHIRNRLNFSNLRGTGTLWTHWRLVTAKRVTGKQCRPISDTAERGIWSGSPLFDQTLQNTASNQGLHCLQIVQPFFFRNIYSLCWGFMAQSTHWGHVECSQFTKQHVYLAGLVLHAVNQYCANSFVSGEQTGKHLQCLPSNWMAESQSIVPSPLNENYV